MNAVVRCDLNQAAEGLFARVDLIIELTVYGEGGGQLDGRMVAWPAALRVMTSGATGGGGPSIVTDCARASSVHASATIDARRRARWRRYRLINGQLSAGNTILSDALFYRPHRSASVRAECHYSGQHGIDQ